MAAGWKLREVETELMKELEETTILASKLAGKYGVCSQAISAFCKRKGIKRPKRGHPENCPVCRRLIVIANQDQSDFISSKTIQNKLKVGYKAFLYHVGILRKKGLISQRFGKLYSRKAERAYKLYFKKGLSIEAIGKQVGLKNFHSYVRRHRAGGWDIPICCKRNINFNPERG